MKENFGWTGANKVYLITNSKYFKCHSCKLPSLSKKGRLLHDKKKHIQVCSYNCAVKSREKKNYFGCGCGG